MKVLVIGRKGFLSKSLIGNAIPVTLFVTESDLNDLSKQIIDSIQRIVLISFDADLREKYGNICRIERKILKIFNPEKILIQYFSTSKVYPNVLNIKEDHALDPNSFYADNKIIAEDFIRGHFKNFHIFRTANLFNSFGGAPNTFLDNVIKNLSIGKIFFDVSKLSYRDFISTNFLAELIKNPISPETGTYNVSSGIPLQVFEIIDAIIEGNSLKRSSLNEEYGSVILNQTLNNTKMLKSFGYNKFNKTILLKEMGDISAK